MSGTKTLLQRVRVGFVAVAAGSMVAGAAVSAHDETDPTTASTFELAMPDDGVSSLPVFKGPFPDTENIEFLSQVDPEDLGAQPVPGVWAKGMMNDLWGWTSPVTSFR